MFQTRTVGYQPIVGDTQESNSILGGIALPGIPTCRTSASIRLRPDIPLSCKTLREAGSSLFGVIEGTSTFPFFRALPKALMAYDAEG